MKVFIRADGGHHIGLGHIMRTLALAGELKNHAEIVFVCSEGKDYKPGVDLIESKGYNTITISDDKELETISTGSENCLITDTYNIGPDYFKYTRKLFSVTGYIDDINKHNFDLDFLINQNVYAQDLHYEINADAVLFLGTKYVILRPEFSNAPVKAVKEEIRDILVTVGGSDPGHLTGEIIHSVAQNLKDTIIHVVLGPVFSGKEEIKRGKSDSIRFYENADMFGLMQHCDAAVSGCGTTIYELAACGIPTIGIAAADNQLRAAQKLDELGIILHSEVQEVGARVKALDYKKRLDMSIAGRRLVDGKGAKRLADKIFTLWKTGY